MYALIVTVSQPALAAWPREISIPALDSDSSVYAGYGDLDGDRRPDLFVVADVATWLRGDDPEPQQWAAVDLRGFAGTQAHVIDLDGDGDNDLATTMGWVENDGAGGFSEPRSLGGCPGVGFDDLDGDGDPDVWGNDRWCANDGRGGFDGGRQLSGSALVALDADADGDVDLIQRDDRQRVTVFENDGDGRFTAGPTLTTTYASSFVAIDVDADGDEDVAWFDSDTLAWVPFGPNGPGALESMATPYSPGRLFVADLDGDGRSDLSLQDAWYPQVSGGGFGAPTDLSIGSPRAAFDLDGDGDADLVTDRGWVENPGYPDRDGDGLNDDAEARLGTGARRHDSDDDGASDHAEVLAGADPLDPDDRDRDGDHLSDAFERQAGTSPSRGDTDGDGLWDAAELDRGTDPTNPDTDGDGFDDGQEVNCRSNPEDALEHDRDCDGLDDWLERALGTHPRDDDTDDDGLLDGTEVDLGSDPTRRDTDRGGTDDGEEHARGGDVRDATDDWRRHVAYSVHDAISLAVGDLDGDGDADIGACFDDSGASAVTLESDTDGDSFQAHDLGPSDFVSFGDLDGDGALDILLDGRWIAGDGGPGGSLTAWRGRAVDTDGDGDLDVVSPSGLEENLGGGVFAPVASFGVGNMFAVEPGDLDGDGDADLAWTWNDRLSWLENLGANVFSSSLIEQTGPNHRDLAVADIDGDATAEILAVSGSALRVGGPGGMERLDTDADAATAGDLDGDGVPETVWVGTSVVWSPAGVLADPHPITRNTGVAVGLGDVDGDGDLDVVVASARAESVEWYENALVTCWADQDGDGFGGRVADCSGATIGVGGDCADRDALRNPDAVETPEDGIDQDCNGIDGFPAPPLPPTAAAVAVIAATGTRSPGPAPRGCDHTGGAPIAAALACVALARRRRR